MTTRIHLARTGTFRDALDRVVTVDDAMLSDLADSYDAARFKAPLVLGHPEDGAPAHGWVEGLSVEDGNLYAQVGEVSTDLADAVKAGRYRNVSISWWPKGHENSPAKDHAALRHVGVLGAQVPVVKGLQPLSFAADDDGIVAIEFADTAFGWRTVKMVVRGMREWLIESAGQEKADQVVPAYYIDTLDEAADRADEAAPRSFEDPSNPHANPPETKPEVTSMSGDKDKKPEATTDLAEREAALAEREAAIKAREAEIETAAAEGRKSAAIAFADGLIKDGKLMPAGKDVVADLHSRLAVSDEPIAFADGTEKPALKSFEDLFAGAKPIIDLGEASAADQASEIDGANQADLTRRANEIQKDNPAISFAEAVRQAEKEADQ